MDQLLKLAREIQDGKYRASATDDFASIYGELEDVIDALMPPNPVEIRFINGTGLVYKNQIDAGFVAGRVEYQSGGYQELLKVAGKLRQRIANPSISRDERSITTTLASLRRFRECTQYLAQPPANERDVQDIIWIMLRAQFDRVEREETLPRFGVKAYRPDFGVPDLRLLLEVKFIGSSTQVGNLQDQLLADLQGYIDGNPRYSSVILFVYDHAHKLRDPTKFEVDLRRIEEVADVIVIPGVAAGLSRPTTDTLPVDSE